VEFENDRGDWIQKSFHSNRDSAENVADVTAKNYTARITENGKIIQVYEREEP
jgi:K+/H+ antiporter YhaU regulatory subunit KhtT